MHCIDGLPPLIKPPSAAPGAPTTTQGHTVVATEIGVEMAEVLIPHQSLYATVVQQQNC